MKFRLLYLLWLFPCYLAFISIQQLNVYRGTIYTYNNGESIALMSPISTSNKLLHKAMATLI